MTWQSGGGGGGASYPGVTGDGLTPGGVTIAGHLRVENNLAQVEEIYSGSGGPIDTATQTLIGTMTASGISSVPFTLAPDSLSFNVPVAGNYRHEFSIALTAGTTGGDIEVRLLQDDFILDRWEFTLAANAKSILNGWMVDGFDPSNVCQYAVYQANGAGWVMSVQPFINLRLIT